MKKLIVLLAITAGLSGCGIHGQGVINGKWVEVPRGQVWCLGTDSGGLECDWEGMKTK